MGGALLRGWSAAGIGPVAVIDPNVGEIAGAQKLGGYDEVAGLEGPLAVVAAVKPPLVVETLRAIRSAFRADSMVLSIAAGVTLNQMRAAIGEAPALVRTMPNTPAAIGKGVVAAISDRALRPDARRTADRLLGAAGEVVWLEGEDQIDAVTAVSGSGPAYFFRFTEALAEAGHRLGLPDALAARLAARTFTGAAALLEATGRDPGELRAEVTSPNGTTAAALARFDDGDRLQALVDEAAEACARRSKEMSAG